MASPGRTRPEFHVRASPGGLGGGNGPFWTAVKTGLFDEAGISVEVPPEGHGGRRLTDALMAGDIQFANTGATGLVQANLAGADLVAIIGLANRLLYQVMAAPEVRTPGDLRGKALAVSRGSTDQALWHWYLRRNGISEDEVRFLELPGHDQQIEALRQGRVHAMTLSPAGSTLLKKEGFTELADFEAERIPFQLGCVMARRSYLEANQEAARRFVRGYRAGIRRYSGDRALGLQVLQGYTGIDDTGVLSHAYDVFVRNFDDPPAPSVAGIQAVLDALAGSDPRAAGLRPEELVDLRFLA